MSNLTDSVENGSIRPPVELTDQHIEALSKQDSRPLTEFKAKKFRETAQKQWDLFYKRNEDRFFKVWSFSLISSQLVILIFNILNRKHSLGLLIAIKN